MNAGTKVYFTAVFISGLALATLPEFGCTTRAEKTRSMSEKTSIPPIASFGNVRIGYSTQEDLARVWGEGEVITGGHPNSGRVWRVEGSSWRVKTDGFEYSERGLVVDSLELLRDDRLGRNAPWARLSVQDFGWLRPVTPGMSRSAVEEFLRRTSLACTRTAKGLEVSVKGYHALQGVSLGTWTAEFDFTEDVLSGVAITAAP